MQTKKIKKIKKKSKISRHEIQDIKCKAYLSDLYFSSFTADLFHTEQCPELCWPAEM